MTATCGYSHDVSDERFDDIDGDRWVCSREALSDNEPCLFHANPDRVDETAVCDQLLHAVAGGSGPVRLIGASLGALDLDYAVLDGPSNQPLDLRESTISGSVSLRHATVKMPLLFQGSHLRETLDLEDSVLTRRVDFGGATLAGRVSFRMADFRSWLDLGGTEFRGPVYARVARFRRGIYGVETLFTDAADFLNTRFDDVANFYRATFESGAVFDSSTFTGNAQFIEATIDAPAVKLDSASGNPRSTAETLNGVALSMNNVTCEREFRLTDATLTGDVTFTGSDLGRDLQTGGLSADGSDVVVDCTDTSVISGVVGGDAESVTYDMTEAVVGEVELVDNAAFSVFRFDATTFEGFDFSSYKRELAAIDWQLHNDANQSPERLENLYLRAKNGANEIGDSRAASEFFTREMDYVRRGHWRRMVETASPVTALKSAGKWISNVSLKVSCGYGERPLRPVFFSLIVILLFSGVYAAFDAPITYTKPLGFVIFSIVSFVSIILGLPEAAGTLLSFVIAVEAFIGGFTIALFVFTLTRSISR
ncbi:pentapeptide repeat-containing protein [Haloarcula japonica]|uniref:Pentapeptide repeat-containing protein n=1 Tax=Haloarcula japonica (strain ATCC 49778 / DSM 6131 / JCM 7785 / NBRC 101032 / NCIMB 13157 / TR-1) TaxID=1227453 RepID=M0LBJ6_HALJT|nr:pentapeptide repeat-containing protein [Haloarcula japonica]EMA29809.1 hypothetical protein C444_13457 [Haloarcula japonica DSM 6131]